MRTTIALFNKKGNSAVSTVIDTLKNTQRNQTMNFVVASPEKMVSNKSLEMLSRQCINSSVIIGCSFTDDTKKAYSFLQLDNTMTVFEGEIYTPIIKETFTQETTKNFFQNKTQLHTLIEKNEGNYSAFILKKEEIAVVRDLIGTQPLYYGENKDLAAFASNRKTLWQLNINEVLTFPPGNLCLLTSAGFQFKPVKSFIYEEPIRISMDDAVWKIQKFLEQAIETRVAGFKAVAVAFSGGLDSSLIAYMISKCGIKVDLIHVSLENETEIETAFEASEKLGLPMQVHLFKESDVEKTLPQIVDLIEETDLVKTAIGVPVYWLAQKTREAGYQILFAGQGADELFGGYQRYVTEYCKDGSEKVRQTMFNDVKRIHENNLERDKKICIATDVDLRMPFCSFDLAEFALSLPVDLKFEQKQDSLRKLVLRKVALNLGLPESIANKPKKAIQYSTGINNAIKRIAQKNGQTVNEYVTDLFKRKY
ncbi:MAG: asparagine synthetase B [Nitrososphaerota archaeon]|jgi:asparagine synthase (glutamine-hydrolysing)|nr:asparagine synthetase B [Nitrososphaerota archaeon]